MKNRVVGVLLLSLLSACGGGGNDAVTATPPGSFALTNQDLVAGGGYYYDPHLFEVGTTQNAVLTMTADFDTYLLLFSEEVLTIPDLVDWLPYLVAENNDMAPSTNTNSEIQVANLAAGRYVAIATSYVPGVTGVYSLTTRLVDLAMAPTASCYLQFRTHENPALNHYRAWIDLTIQGNLIQESDLQDIRIFDPLGSELLPRIAPQFILSRYTTARWNSLTGQFDFIAAGGQSGIFFNLSDQASLPSGNYRFVVQPVAGGTFNIDLDYPWDTLLEPITALGMQAIRNLDGSLNLSWTEPSDNPDQYRIHFTDTLGRDLFYGRVMPGTSQVTLSPGLLQQILQNGSLATPATIQWRMQTRSLNGSNNYARSMSDPVLIELP